jgi:hypothetical protein
VHQSEPEADLAMAFNVTGAGKIQG